MFQAVAREWISATFVAVTMLAWTAMVSQMEMQSSIAARSAMEMGSPVLVVMVC